MCLSRTEILPGFAAHYSHVSSLDGPRGKRCITGGASIRAKKIKVEGCGRVANLYRRDLLLFSRQLSFSTLVGAGRRSPLISRLKASYKSDKNGLPTCSQLAETVFSVRFSTLALLLAERGEYRLFCESKQREALRALWGRGERRSHKTLRSPRRSRRRETQTPAKVRHPARHPEPKRAPHPHTHTRRSDNARNVRSWPDSLTLARLACAQGKKVNAQARNNDPER